MQANNPEQRRSPRSPRLHPVVVVFGDGTKDGVRLPGQVIDVSSDGVAVKCAYDLTENPDLVLDFSPNHHPKPARVAAVVRNRRGDVYGIQFQPHSEEECKSLDWIDGILLASGFQVEDYSPSWKIGRTLALVTALASGLALGGLAGGLLHSTLVGTGIASAIGAVVAFAAYTL